MPERNSFSSEAHANQKVSRTSMLPIAEYPEPTAAATLTVIKSLITKAPPTPGELARMGSEPAIIFLQNSGEVVHLPGRSTKVTSLREDNQAAAKISAALHIGHVIKAGEIPSGYWKKQRRIQREQGRGDVDMRSREWREFKKQATEAMIADQSASLNTWINYLLSPDAASAYTPLARMWVLSEVITLSRYDRENRRFRSRDSDEGKTAPFPELNPEALAIIIDVDGKYHSSNPDPILIIEDIRRTKKRIKVLSGEARDKRSSEPNRSTAQRELTETQQQLDQLYMAEDELLGFGDLFAPEAEEDPIYRKQRLDNRNEVYQQVGSRNFAKLYAWAIEAVTPMSAEGLSIIDGKWKKYEKGSDPKPLVESLQGRGTGWCTAGESTAKLQLANEDFYVYYSKDSRGDPIIPRVAIRMEDDQIAEVRGIADGQNLDSYITPKVEEKLREFPDGEMYQRKVADMQRLTGIEQKIASKELLDVADLNFLYEIDRSILGFGMDSDPRIDEIKEKRNSEKDMLTIFGCESSEVAHSAEEISEATRAYVGSLAPGIFSALRKYAIEHVYTRFPEGKIRFETITIGGKSPDKLKDDLQQNDMEYYEGYKIKDTSFEVTTLPEPQQIDVVRIEASDLLWDGQYWSKPKMTLGNLYERAQALGLTFCPAETAMQYRLQYTDQPDEYHNQLYVVMQPELAVFSKGIEDVYPTVFRLFASDGQMRLYHDLEYATNEQSSRDEFLFQLPPEETTIAA